MFDVEFSNLGIFLTSLGHVFIPKFGDETECFSGTSLTQGRREDKPLVGFSWPDDRLKSRLRGD